jgi:hypothetical protein
MLVLLSRVPPAPGLATWRTGFCAARGREGGVVKAAAHARCRADVAPTANRFA